MTDESSTLDPEWLARQLKANPIAKTAAGNYLTGLVRLSFPALFQRAKAMEEGKEGAFQANILFPVGTDMTLLKKAAAECALGKWPKGVLPSGKKPRSPFKDQEEMLRYEGYAAGGEFLTVTNRRKKPAVVDAKGVLITDETRVYPGVWAVCVINPFSYAQKTNKGVSFGLQSVMLVADDKSFGGGGESVASAFEGVNIETAGVDTSALFD